MHEGASLRAAVFMLLGVLTGCQSLSASEKAASVTPSAKIRFLLTFDDGPSIQADDNPTLSILEQLAVNDVQPGIKAVFFVQTRNAMAAAPRLARPSCARPTPPGIFWDCTAPHRAVMSRISG